MKAVFALVLNLFITSTCFSGVFGTRGGGDVLAQEFFTIIESQFYYLPLSSETKVIELYKKLNSLKFSVRFTDENLFLENQPVQAINSPNEGLITISKKQWMTLSKEQKELLSFHEAVGVLGYEDNDYHFSNFIRNQILLIKNSPFLHWKNKLQIVLNEGLPHQFYVSEKAIFAYNQKETTELLCSAEYLKSKGNFPLKLKEAQATKAFFISPDYSYQHNTIILNFYSQNETSILKLTCNNGSSSLASFPFPENYTLEQVLTALKPILNHIKISN